MKLQCPKELKGKSICFCQVGQLINEYRICFDIYFLYMALQI